MIQSMTGFGRGEASSQDYKIEVEMKSVNHRYLDVSVRLPRKFTFYESEIRNQAKQFAERGKVDIYVTFSDLTGSTVRISCNREVAASYLSGIRQLSRELKLEDRTAAYDIARLPDVFTQEEWSVDEEMLAPLLGTAMRQAGMRFVESRMAEGRGLQEDLARKLNRIEELVDAIAQRMPGIVEEYRQKIRDKVAELLGDAQVDEGVLATELVVFADKVCVDEEMVRLRTHIVHIKETLGEKGTIGRKLDFITQEMNREANTILSKANDTQVSHDGIELKTEIEKFREQIQNIE